MTTHGRQATVTGDHGTKMVVAQTIKDKVIFYPHSEPVTMTADEVIEMVCKLCERPTVNK